MKEKVDFDRYVAPYNSILENQLGFFDGEEYFAAYKVNLLREWANSGALKILDFGCGIGRSIKFLQQAFPDAKIFGTDVSKSSLKKAQEEHRNSDFFQLNKTHEYKSQFDVIFIAGVFHHIDPKLRRGIMQQLLELLTDDGELFIFEHNPLNPVTRHMVNNCPFDEDAILLKPKELIELFESAQLKVQGKGYVLFFPSYLRALRVLEKHLKWLPLGGQYFVWAKK
jgi:SAM-dependent methyltransferase